MHQAVEIKLQGKALSGKKNKPVVCCRMCSCTLCVFSSKCMCVWETGGREGGGKGDSKRRGERRGGGVHRGPQGGWGAQANWASTYTSPPTISHSSPPHTIHHPPFLMFKKWKRNKCKHHCSSNGVQPKKKISSAWNVFSHSFFSLTPLLLVFVQWFA